MKFLCVSCDEPMKMQRVAPPEGGSITAVYACPTCSHQIAMLTNPHETQLVQSLGVKIGPGEQAAAAAPEGAPGELATAGEAAAEEGQSGCPFSGLLAEMQASPDDDGVTWTPEALARLENIPEFVRPMARQGIEHYARTNGHNVVDDAVMEEARGRFGM